MRRAGVQEWAHRCRSSCRPWYAPCTATAASATAALVTSVLLLSAVVGVPTASAYVHVSSRAKSQLLEFVRTLPIRGDALQAMSDPLRTSWASDLKMTAAGTLQALSEPRATITVDVKLVGFSGDG